MQHTLPELPFEKSALEPFISRETMEYHYGKHHKAYVEKLNTLIKGTEYENMSLFDIVLKSSGPIFNNAAQDWNHTFFWHCLTPRSSRKPEGLLWDAIKRDFKSFDDFQDQFLTAAANQFGSGWCWLVKRRDQKLGIRATSNAETPFAYGEVPLLTCDVWEHAYYIDYRNERQKFVKSVWNIVNWEFVQQNYGAAIQAAA
jgi:Fe-Mn family superoxide dismutase